MNRSLELQATGQQNLKGSTVDNSLVNKFDQVLVSSASRKQSW